MLDFVKGELFQDNSKYLTKRQEFRVSKDVKSLLRECQLIHKNNFGQRKYIFLK